MTAISKVEKINGAEAVCVYRSFDIKDALKEIGYKFDGEKKAWWIDAAKTDALKATYQLLAATPGANTAGVEQILARGEVKQPRKDLTPEVNDLDGPMPLGAKRLASEFGLELFDFQKRGAYWASQRKASLIADSMGLGKTRQALAACLHDDRVLIVCPAVVKTHWAREAAAGYGINESDVVILSGRKPSPIENARVIVVNYDVIDAWVSELTKVTPTAVILDECHMLKTQTSRRTKAVTKLINELNEPRVVALSGTPMLNRPVELWPLLQLLGVANHFGGNFMAFTKTYCAGHYESIYSGKQVWKCDGASNTQELSRLLFRHIAIRREKEEVLDDLPLRQEHFVELDLEGALKEYRKVERELKRTIKGATRAKQALDAQSVQGHVATMCRLAGEAKTPSAIAYIEEQLEAPGKIVVFAHHTAVFDALMEGLSKHGVVGINGSTPPGKRQDIVDSFQTDPSVRIFVGQSAAAGVGITLTAADRCVFVEPEWTPSLVEQARDRINRIGQTSDRITVSYLVATECATDTYQYDALRNKRTVINTILGTEEQESLGTVAQTSMVAFAKSLSRS